jgi:hypothetical protein
MRRVVLVRLGRNFATADGRCAGIIYFDCVPNLSSCDLRAPQHDDLSCDHHVSIASTRLATVFNCVP